MEGNTDMAELPRYENLGVQYADLPKISTAMQQIKAQGYAGVEQSLDRMTNFFQEKAVTEAQKKALKYAIELPPTPEQLLEAKKTGQMPVIKGAGSVFTETYNKATAHILGNQLQTEFQNRTAARLNAMERGAVLDVTTLQRDLRDDIDGTISVLTAIDPETSIKFRASMATIGHGVYKQALVIDEKNRQLSYAADQEAALMSIKPVVENVIKSYADIGMDPAELENILQNVIQPFTNKTSITLSGSEKYAIEAYKIVQEAKVGAVLTKLSDPIFAPSVGVAAQKLMNGDVGELTGLYNRLDKETKNKIRSAHMKLVSDAKQFTDIEDEKRKAENKIKGNELTIEFLRPDTKPARKQEILTEMIRLDEMNLTTAMELMKPKEVEPNPVLTMNLYENIKNGRIKSIKELVPYSSKMSRAEFESLGRSLVDNQAKIALERIDREAGIVSPFIDPGAEKLKKKIDLTERYYQELQKQVVGEKGVKRYLTPEEALNNALKGYGGDKIVIDKETKRKQAQEKIDNFFSKKPDVKKPNTPLDQTDFSKVPGLSSDEVTRLNKAKKDYQDNL
jgi:hypothetical protein